MSFLAPLWLGVAGVAALGVVGLHLMATRRPPRMLLPTARFVPESAPVQAVRAARPSDFLLLLLRVVTVMLLGAAFAGPVRLLRSRNPARLLLVDASRSALADTRDSALALWREGDALVLFDSGSRPVAAAADSLRVLVSGKARGSLSAALVGAARQAGALAPRGDSIALVIVSPLTRDEIDAATGLLVAAWHGPVRLVRPRPAAASGVTVDVEGADASAALGPLAQMFSEQQGFTGQSQRVRVTRTSFTAADSGLAAAGVAVVSWPMGEMARARPAGVWTEGASLVAPLEPLSIDAPGGVTVREQALRSARSTVVARWADGTAAALETSLGRGCLRRIGIGIPPDGDVSFQPAALALTRRLLAPCGGPGPAVAISDSDARTLVTGNAGSTARLDANALTASPLAPWLAALAVVLLVAELLVRRSRGGVT